MVTTDAPLTVGALLVVLGVFLLLVAAIAWPTKRTPVYAHAGAVPGWSPAAEVSRAVANQDRIADLVAAERAELADAAASLAPLITAEHDAMAVAWRAFDAAMVAPMRTAKLWHMYDREFCARCSGQDGEVFGHLGADHEHTGIRAFRIDTPTGEYPIVRSFNPCGEYTA